MASLFLLTISLLLPLSSPEPQPPPSPVTGFRAQLTHVDSGAILSPLDAISLSLRRHRTRHHPLSSPLRGGPRGGGGFESPLRAAPGEYHLHLSIGSPPVPLTGLLDTGSDLIWTKCDGQDSATCPCLPKKSYTFFNVSCSSYFCRALTDRSCGGGGRSCNYSFVYGDESFSEGFLGSDLFRFGDGSTRVRFGCGVANGGVGMASNKGLVGFGRGPLSLVSQLGAKRFAYCLPASTRPGNGSLLVGSVVGPDSGRSTRLRPNRANPMFYYVELEGITVGRRRVRIPKEVFRVGEGGEGGVIIDTGTSVSMLVEEAYDIVREAVVDQVGLEVSRKDDFGGLDLCYDLSKMEGDDAPRIPGMVFHFKNMDVRLPPENFVIVDVSKNLTCLAMAPSWGISVIGNWQQQNVMVTYDLRKKRVSMVPRSCHTV